MFFNYEVAFTPLILHHETFSSCLGSELRSQTEIHPLWFRS